jgi:protein-S-isoprenylcysteine O-methyltransferase Ste14
LQIVALIYMILGFGLFAWAMAANPFFSTAVRVQQDRGQTVVTNGPYRYVRHPGYLGMIVFSLATPLMLASLWALVPAVLLTVGIVSRTSLEDGVLKGGLEGYGEYARRVRYRLVPGIW